MTDRKQACIKLFITTKEDEGNVVELKSITPIAEKLKTPACAPEGIIVLNNKPHFLTVANLSDNTIEALQRTITASNAAADYPEFCQLTGIANGILLIISVDQSPLYDMRIHEDLMNRYNKHVLGDWGCGDSRINEIYFCVEVAVENTWQRICVSIADVSMITEIRDQFVANQELRKEYGLPLKEVQQ